MCPQGPSAHLGPRAFWLGGVWSVGQLSEDGRGLGSVGHVVAVALSPPSPRSLGLGKTALFRCCDAPQKNKKITKRRRKEGKEEEKRRKGREEKKERKRRKGREKRKERKGKERREEEKGKGGRGGSDKGE